MTDRNDTRETDRILGALQANAEHAETARRESAADREQIKRSIGAIQATIMPLVGLPERVERLEETTNTLTQESAERRGAAKAHAALYGAGGSGAMIALYSAGKWLAGLAGLLPR